MMNVGMMKMMDVRVVEKIESESISVSIEDDTCEIYNSTSSAFKKIFTDGETKLEATYKAVVEFIKWHNQNHENN